MATSENAEIAPGYAEDGDNFEENQKSSRRLCKWSPTSESLLREANDNVLAYVKSPYQGHHVNIGPVVGKEDCKIWTISFTENGQGKIPLVMLHGLCSGVGLWALNLDELAADQPVHAIDLLGFGRSSRPKFSSKSREAENQLVESIEAWRNEMKLDRIVLLGHSFGGYLATAYTLKYPDRIAHLVLADPWGYSEKPADISQKYPIPLWTKMLVQLVQPLNPLWALRAAGPIGPSLIQKARPDLIKKFSILGEDTDNKFADYIFHCNAQNPTGEAAFHSIMNQFAWAKNPMINRISAMDKSIPMTFIYGKNSWTDHCPDELIKEKRPTSKVEFHYIPNAGHHVYADDKEKFNNIVLELCRS